MTNFAVQERGGSGVCVVTGGASGLGAAIVEHLREDGWDVVVGDIDTSVAGVIACDVRSAADVEALVAHAAARGPLKGLVLSAAVETRAGVVDCTDDDWQTVIDTNLKGPFLCMRAAVPAMVAAGGGSIVALGSTLGMIVAPQFPAYCASKYALTNLCKQVAIEHAGDGVRVNVVAPTATDTGLFMRLTALAPDPDAVRAGVARNLPMARLGTAREVCDAVAFLLSDQASYISGAVLPLDGGLAREAHVIDGFRVLDADGHVIEPAHVFAEWAPPGAASIDLPADTPMVPCGDFALVTDQFEHGFDPPSYLRAMDRQGIDGAVLYPSIGLFVPFLPALDAAASAAACRAYNEWLGAYTAHEPARLAGVGLVPLADVDLAVREADHAAELGLIGITVRPNHLYGRNLGDAVYDPLWARCAERGLTVSVHEGLGLHGATIGADRFTGFAARHALSHPMEQMAAMASLVLDGALERHPALRVAFLESGTGWLPYWLARLDDHIEWLTPGRPAASELFAAHAVISSEADDDCVGMVAARLGAEHVMWASDFPHPDAVFPGAPGAFLHECEEQGIDEDDARVILWDTPLRFYGLAGRFS